MNGPAGAPALSPRRAPLLLIGGLLVTLGLLLCGWEARRHFILPGVTVAGLPVGGLTLREAERKLAYLAPLVDRPLVLQHGAWEQVVTPREVGLSLDVAATLRAAYAPGHTGPLAEQLQAWLRAGKALEAVEPVLRWHEETFRTWLAALRAAHARRPIEAGWRVTPGGGVEVTPAAVGQDISAEVLRQRLVALVQSETGPRRLELPIHTVHPRLTTAEALSFGVREVVARYRTHFDPRDRNRTQNIRLAAGALDQTVLQPGEVFSFNLAVGPRVPASGYLEAPVVVNNRLVPGVGGGVCQVSSTLYNAALLADLAVVTRHRHSVPSAYVPPGRDATVAYDYFDLRLRNGYEWPVVLDSEVGQGWVEVRVLGRRRPGERLAVETEILETYPPPAEEVPDPRLPTGQRVLAAKGAPGYRVRVWQVRYQDGVQVERRLLSEDAYQPLRALVRVGTGTR